MPADAKLQSSSLETGLDAKRVFFASGISVMVNWYLFDVRRGPAKYN